MLNRQNTKINRLNTDICGGLQLGSWHLLLVHLYFTTSPRTVTGSLTRDGLTQTGG